MAFIGTVAPAEAQGPVREMYERVRGRFGYVTNWARAFSPRPGVLDGWTALLQSIQANLPVRTYELATLAAARALRSSYCSLAHGTVLATKVFDPPAVTAIATGVPGSPLEPRERAMMAFVERVVLPADRITAADGAARCFFSKLLDALGVQADAKFNELDPALRRALTVGRPVADGPESLLPSEVPTWRGLRRGPADGLDGTGRW